MKILLDLGTEKLPAADVSFSVLETDVCQHGRYFVRQQTVRWLLQNVCRLLIGLFLLICVVAVVSM